MRLLSAILGAALALSPQFADEPAARSVVLTFDDLPMAGGGRSATDVVRVTDGILDALKRHEAPAVAFVTTKNVFVNGQVDLRLDQLRRWRDAGNPLENHSYAHPSFRRTPLEDYQDDALLGDLIPRMLMAEKGRAPRYYRHPYNHTGPDHEAKAAFERFMSQRGYRIAPFTVEHSDYAFNALYVDALRRDDAEGARKIGAAYLEQLDVAFDFAEKLSRETFDREIPQVFLIHANDINADYLDPMLERLARRGYRFVSTEQVLRDEAYATPEDYVGPSGISWLHRWRLSKGLDNRLRDEPDPPRWILEAYRQLQGR